MFDHLTGRLTTVFDKLRGKKSLGESEVTEALRDIRIALLEADVALPIVRDFISRVKEKAVGEALIRGVDAGQQVVKIVFDEIRSMLGVGEESQGLVLTGKPAVILMVGLQGSGKTTTTGKLGLRLTKRLSQKVLLASLDTRRPAAQEQLRLLGEQVQVDTLPIVEGQQALDIARRAQEIAATQGYNVLILDTAGRMVLDDALMEEVVQIKALTAPSEVLLVADSLTGQDALQVATHFHERVGITGIVLTRMDGDGRGGAALSMRAVTGRPVKLLGVGERLDQLDDFDADRVANRILGMGDVVALVERAAEVIKAEDAERFMSRLMAGKFDYNDMLTQMKQMKGMGGFGGIMKLLPGMSQIREQLDQADVDKNVIRRQELMIQSMTKAERANPRLIEESTSRRRRIAKGASVEMEDINQLVKSHKTMADMMNGMGSLMGGLGGGDGGGLFGGGGMMKGLFKGMGGLGGLNNMRKMMKQMTGGGGQMPSPEEMEAMMKKMGLPTDMDPNNMDMGKMMEMMSSKMGGGKSTLPPGVPPPKGRFRR